MRDRFLSYSGDECWQHYIKRETLEEDRQRYPSALIDNININDMEFSFVPKEDKKTCQEIKAFIERYEWLGKMPVWITHRFIATYQGVMVGAVIMATPNAFSNLLGKGNRKLEKLISRGASISFAPKNTASWLIMKSIRWMVDNTEFRFFTAYADPLAGELGTIYQACNFYYLGNNHGGGKMYKYKNVGWVGSSYFAQRSTIKRIAIAHGVDWKPEYIKKNKTGSKRIIAWENMDEETKSFIKAKVKEEREACEFINSPPKHKYVYILSRNKIETNTLKIIFRELNPDLVDMEYPKKRGE